MISPSKMLVQALLACTAALAFPSRETRLANHIEQLAARRGVESPVLVKEATTPIDDGIWGGAVNNGFPNGTFTEVTGTFMVPTTKAGPGPSSIFVAAFWVGIDGDSCQSALWQAGMTIWLEDGDSSYEGWYEWIPQTPVYWDDSQISFAPGDEIIITVTATSTTSGKAVIENVTTKQTVTETLTDQPYDLCLTDTEWIIEDLSIGTDFYYPFIDFGTFTFTNAQATTATGSTIGPANATLYDIANDGNILTSVSSDEDSVTITWLNV